MISSALGNRYARALADVVMSGGAQIQAATAVSELRAFETAVKKSPELRNALLSPAVPPGRKRAVVERIAEMLRVSRISRNFLFVLIDHRRIGLITEIIDAFELIVDERLGFARAEVTSARPLTEPQRTLLNGELERLTGKKIRMRFAVDESLVGGAVARIGSTVYDGSVRGQLNSLRRHLAAEV